jgi:hypothetical protein
MELLFITLHGPVTLDGCVPRPLTTPVELARVPASEYLKQHLPSFASALGANVE